MVVTLTLTQEAAAAAGLSSTSMLLVLQQQQPDLCRHFLRAHKRLYLFSKAMEKFCSSTSRLLQGKPAYGLNRLSRKFLPLQMCVCLSVFLVPIPFSLLASVDCELFWPALSPKDGMSEAVPTRLGMSNIPSLYLPMCVYVCVPSPISVLLRAGEICMPCIMQWALRAPNRCLPTYLISFSIST